MDVGYGIVNEHSQPSGHDVVCVTGLTAHISAPSIQVGHAQRGDEKTVDVDDPPGPGTSVVGYTHQEGTSAGR